MQTQIRLLFSEQSDEGLHYLPLLPFILYPSKLYWLLLLPLFMEVMCLVFSCYAVLSVLSSFEIILMRKRELVALL